MQLSAMPIYFHCVWTRGTETYEARTIMSALDIAVSVMASKGYVLKSTTIIQEK